MKHLAVFGDVHGHLRLMFQLARRAWASPLSVSAQSNQPSNRPSRSAIDCPCRMTRKVVKLTFAIVTFSQFCGYKRPGQKRNTGFTKHSLFASFSFDDVCQIG